MILVHNSPTTLQPYWQRNLGVLSSPRRWYTENEIGAWPWAADNDAFSDWSPDRYNRMLEAITDMPGCLFVTLPDIVANAKSTDAKFAMWRQTVRFTNQPIAYVAQDGQIPGQVPWDEIDAVFIGGSTPYKMGVEARGLVRWAKARGKWVHMGRVNTHQRVRYAKAIGCDSIDGTAFSRFRDTYLRKFLAHAAQPPQLILEATS
jgi:hypothetical protein